MKRFEMLFVFIMLAVLMIASIAYAGQNLNYEDWGKGNTWPKWLDTNETDRNQVVEAVNRGIYIGYVEGGKKYLKLTNEITRAEFATALARVLGVNNEQSDPWYKGNVDALVNIGIIEDDGGNWNEPITREEMGIWVGKTIAVKNIGVNKNIEIKFMDTNNEDIIRAAKVGVIKGYGNGGYGINDKSQRVHSALMLIRLDELLDKNIPEGWYYHKGFIVPEDTSEFGYFNTHSESHPDMIMDIDVDVDKPLKPQYEKLYKILESKYGAKIASEVVDYVKIKQDRFIECKLRIWEANGDRILVDSGWGYYNIQILIAKK